MQLYIISPYYLTFHLFLTRWLPPLLFFNALLREFCTFYPESLNRLKHTVIFIIPHCALFPDNVIQAIRIVVNTLVHEIYLILIVPKNWVKWVTKNTMLTVNVLIRKICFFTVVVKFPLIHFWRASELLFDLAKFISVLKRSITAHPTSTIIH